MPEPRLRSPEAIDDLLLYRLSRLFTTAGGMVTRLCEGQFRITRREWRIVAQLAREPGLLSSQLAERAQLDRARTSRAVTSLVGKKLVARETGRGDRRQARLELTGGGRALYQDLFPRVRQLTVKGASHWVHTDAPEVVTEALRRFVAPLQEGAR